MERIVRQQHPQMPHPTDGQAWIVGGGIASLAVAVFLIHDANVPPSHIHLFDVHSHPGGGITSFGDPTSGYVVHEGRQISSYDSCTERFLSLVPPLKDAAKTLRNKLGDISLDDRYQKKSPTCIIVQKGSSLQKFDTGKLGLTVQDRVQLTHIMLQSEETLQGKKISDVFHPEFFSTMFWVIWATTFVFRPEHSVAELRRHLRKHVYDIVNMQSVPIADKTRYTKYESIIQPVTNYLEEQGVDFRLNDLVFDIEMDTEDDPRLVSRIKYQSPAGLDLHVTVESNDLTFITLGSVSSGSVQGTNTAPAEMKSRVVHDCAWSLWHRLAEKTSKFGNPSNFSTHIKDSRLMTFTMTIKDFEFFEQVQRLTHYLPGSQTVLSLASTRWLISLNIPCQPVFHGQPADVRIIWGWALHPENQGNYIRKPMFSCSGEDIMTELLQHLRFPLVPTLNCSITIPCINPLSAAPLITRSSGDRPAVVPDGMANVALLGQFVDIANEATMSMEYSVRGAQIAVYHLMGLRKEVPKAYRIDTSKYLDLFVDPPLT